MAEPTADVAAVREFNRFYTRQIGILQEGILRSPYSLTDVRVLYEIIHSDGITATDLCSVLELDAGYLSRILDRFLSLKLVQKRQIPEDRRQSAISATREGRRVMRGLEQISDSEIHSMLDRLLQEDRRELIDSMHSIRRLLSSPTVSSNSFSLRPPRVGDIGWVIQRHGDLYNREYGWNEQFELLVGDIALDFLRRANPERDRGWIAEVDDRNVGSVFLVSDQDDPNLARLRLLLVDPRARGRGIGKRLVRECTEFARQVGYRKITLWTNSVLHAARAIYIREGYQLVDEEEHHSYGHDLTGQTWELQL